MELALSYAMAGTLLLLFGLLSTFFYAAYLSPAATSRRIRKSGFDGPSPMFPLGNLVEMTKSKKPSSSSSPATSTPLLSGVSSVTNDIHASVFPYFARWRKSFGKVFVYWLGTEPFLYIGDPEFLKQATAGILGKQWGKPDVFRRDRMPMFGKGLVMVEGDDWARHRHIIAPAFSMTNLNDMLSLMEETTSKMLGEWSKLVALGQNEIDVERDIISNAAEIIAKTSFGINSENGTRVFEKLQAMQVMLFKSNRLVGVPLGKLLHLRKAYDAWKLGREIDALLLDIIESRRREGCKAEKHDLLGLLLAGNQESTSSAQLQRKLTTRELVDECKTFFFAGHETTGLALSWTLLMLAAHPEWQTALREEVLEVSGGGPLDATVPSKLTKMGWVLNEVLRLYSPAPNAQRQARQDIAVGDTVIPKGTNMWIDVVAMHHDAALWGDDVYEFRPERFMKDGLHGGSRHRLGFLPFGFGGRICVGRNLTVMEYKIVLSLVLRRFALSVSPTYRHAPRIMLSLRPSNGIQLVLTPLQELS